MPSSAVHGRQKKMQGTRSNQSVFTSVATCARIGQTGGLVALESLLWLRHL